MIGPDHEIWDKYEEMGKRWLAGEVTVDSFEGFDLNDKQKEFVNSKHRFTLNSGGRGSGKTLAFCVKLFLLCMWFPGNRILLGRKTRKLVETMTLPDILDIFPGKGTLFVHKKGPGKLVFGNGSEILMWGLDAAQTGDNTDIKKGEQDIKSLNLGAVFIDQLEEIDESVFEELDGRTRRKNGSEKGSVRFRQLNMTTNPANFWAYDFFKVQDRDDTKLIESSMLDNKENLPDDYLQSQLNKPERYVERYVYGRWDQSIMVDGAVFAEEHQELIKNHVKEPEKTKYGIKIYEEPDSSFYQIGVDPSTGAEDPCYITCVDTLSGRQVASFSDYLPLHAVADKVMKMADMYSVSKKPQIIVEVQGGGEAVIQKLNENNYKLYQREVFGRKNKSKKTKKLGWHTNHSSKLALIDNFIDLLDSKEVAIRDEKVSKEVQTFIWKNNSRSGGAEAQSNYHDDAVMGTMLAYWNVEPKNKGQRTKVKSRFQQDINRVNNKVYNRYD